MVGEQLNALILWAAGMICILAVLAYIAMSFPWILVASYQTLRGITFGDPGSAMVLLTGMILAYLVSQVFFRVEAFSALAQLNLDALQGIADVAAERVVRIFQEILDTMPTMGQ